MKEPRDERCLFKSSHLGYRSKERILQANNFAIFQSKSKETIFSVDIARGVVKF